VKYCELWGTEAWVTKDPLGDHTAARRSMAGQEPAAPVYLARLFAYLALAFI